MTELEEARERYCADFERFKQKAARNGGGWTYPLRKTAISRFAEVGFPTTRDEEWKYTSVAPIVKVRFRRADPRPNGVVPRALAQTGAGELAKNRLVFVNGHYSERLSSVGSLPGGVKVESLAAALVNDPAAVEPYLARHASYQDHAFVALNTAFMEDGAFVHVPKGCVIDEPIHLLFVSTSNGEATVSYPRNLIVIDSDSQVKIVESYVEVGGRGYLTNGVTEVIAGENSVIDHCKLERENETAFHVATLQARLGRSSNFVSHSITLGGALIRNDVNVMLDGEGGDCTLNGLYLGTGERHIDNHTRIDHMKPHCVSRELYKGILDGKVKAVFNGKIVVGKDARKTDAKQTNRNLLLSEEATIDTKPQLEIFNNDVKCSHASTIGRLDENALFYLRSRGLGLETARALLTYAFASEVVNQIKIAPVRAGLDDLLTARLQKICQA
ncbi:MAG: Fe-S cluster assembly protein SufD [Deltaproteobacteria bacterium]|nr:MAG: Fe-S cluster assembly protein SufD [Deltaproteobacteria bacterium]